MLKARDLLRAVDRFRQLKDADIDPETLLRSMNDEQLRTATMVAAETFSALKAEAVRRNIWDEMTRKAST